MEKEHVGGGFDFSHWLRTGRLIRVDARWGAREVKFNPHHDPKDGRFMSGEGGGGASKTEGQTRTRCTGPNDPANYSLYTVKAGDTLHHIAATRVGIKPEDLKDLNGLKSDEIKAGQVLSLDRHHPIDDHLGERVFAVGVEVAKKEPEPEVNGPVRTALSRDPGSDNADLTVNDHSHRRQVEAAVHCRIPHLAHVG